MSVHDDLATAIKTGDALTVERIVQKHPEIVNSPAWTPPPLHFAVFYNQAKIVEILLDHGADIEMRDPDRQSTPLQYAIVYCHTELISLLLSRGAYAGVDAESGMTPMDEAREWSTGALEEHSDTPAKAEYQKVIALLEQLGVE